jgi:hypothetical protein
LLRWGQEHGWHERLRRRENRLWRHEGGEITTGEAVQAGLRSLCHARVEPPRRNNPPRDSTRRRPSRTVHQGLVRAAYPRPCSR